MALLRAHHPLRPRVAFSSRPPLFSSSPCRRALPRSTTTASPSIVADLLDYLCLNESWTQFNATARWPLLLHCDCLCGWGKVQIGNWLGIIAAHTNSPCLKLKPRSVSFKPGHQMVNAQTYGDADGSFKHKPVKVSRPLIRVPMLAIHLDRYSDGFKPNLENHLVPLLATKHEETTANSSEKNSPSSTKILSDEIGCKSDEIIGMELNSGGLDNLASCYHALRSLMDSSKMSEELSSEKAIRMIALFDTEEDGYWHPPEVVVEEEEVPFGILSYSNSPLKSCFSSAKLVRIPKAFFCLKMEDCYVVHLLKAGKSGGAWFEGPAADKYDCTSGQGLV
uniref:aspartyl aminopeptidase n=1 Tax=Oryza punctata TaxID=4537 RepID=A0A0E0LL99_ORYPU